MKFIFDKDSWQEIFGSIKKSKLRTAITVIGVLWGVFLFITLLGAAKGMENGFDREFKNLATNSIFLWAERTERPHKGFQRGRRMRLKIQDAEAIKKQIPEVQFVVPRNVQGVFGGPPASVKRKTNTKTYKLFGHITAARPNMKSYSDLTRRFPHKSSRMNEYLFTIYDYDSNAVL